MPPVQITSNSIRVTNNYAVFINAAFNQEEQSFFKKAFSSVVEGALSSVGASALTTVFDLLFGIDSDPEATELQGISNQIAQLQGEIGNVSMTTNYQQTLLAIQAQITSMNKLVNTNVASLTSTEVQNMITFISPGASGVGNADYSSNIDNLLNVTYASSMSNIFSSSVTAPLQLGTATQCYAQTLNTVLSGLTGAYTLVNNHMQLSSTITATILAICTTANQVYNYLSSNQAAITAQFSTTDSVIGTDLTAALQSQLMKEDISSVTAPTFLPTLLAPALGTAPIGLCGFMFTLISNMIYNTTSPATPANTNIAITNGNGYISPNDNNGGYWTMQYNNGSKYWTAAFSNNTPSDNITLYGANGGYLGFMPGASPAYVYEIISTGIPNVQPATSSVCTWTMMLINNPQTVVFANHMPGSLALANNHGLFESTQPGQYDLGDGTNPDVQWNISF